jgi:hypothetical protein
VREALDRPDVVLFSWDLHLRRVGLRAKQPGEAVPAWIDAGPNAPLWLLRTGWHERNGAFRWIDPVATATVHRPAGSPVFRLRMYALPGPASVEVLVDGQSVGMRKFEGPGGRELEWSVPPAAAHEAAVEFRVNSSHRGIPVVAFGFIVE